MKGVPRWALCIVILLLLAGCTTKEPTAPAEDSDNASTLGRISGATVTPDIRPINGVAVSMMPGNFETESNLFGGFTFSNIPPGTYELTATHKDFLSANQTVVVVPGQTIKPRLVLKTDEPPVPQHVTDTFPGFIPLHTGPAEETTSEAQRQAGLGNCTCVFDIEPRQMMETMVIEATWTDSVAPAQPTKFRWTLTIDDNRTFNGAGAHPLLVHLNAADVGGWQNATSMVLTLAPDEIWPAFEQDFTLYVTIFQVTPAPPDWSFLDGDA